MEISSILNVRDLLYTYDCAIIALSEDDLQRFADSLYAATKRFGLNQHSEDWSDVSTCKGIKHKHAWNKDQQQGP